MLQQEQKTIFSYRYINFNSTFSGQIYYKYYLTAIFSAGFARIMSGKMLILRFSGYRTNDSAGNPDLCAQQGPYADNQRSAAVQLYDFPFHAAEGTAGYNDLISLCKSEFLHAFRVRDVFHNPDEVFHLLVRNLQEGAGAMVYEKASLDLAGIYQGQGPGFDGTEEKQRVVRGRNIMPYTQFRQAKGRLFPLPVAHGSGKPTCLLRPVHLCKDKKNCGKHICNLSKE
jgi:hypothetical protein